ncbi:MAG: translocation protein TolB [Bdellovibrio sp.]
MTFQARAQDAGKGSVYIKVGEAKAQKSLVAFPALQFLGSPGASPNYKSVGSDLFKVVLNDLTVTGYFQFIEQSAYLEDPTKTGLRPFPTDANGFKFESWKQISAEFLIRASFSVSGDSLTLEAYAYHVPKASLVLGKRYKGTVSGARRIAHTFANDLMEALTGQKSMFLSKIVVSSDRGGTAGSKEIFIMDWDGMNIEKITNHKSVAISPAWSPDGNKVAYTAFVMRAKTKTRNADMFIYELNTGKRWLVSYRQGINSGANFDPDGKHVYLTISQGGNPDIFKMSIEGELVKKLTNGPVGAMNVEPAMSADGSKMAFSSDRSGNPMIYVMNADGTNPKRVTFAGKFNASPAWSPDGKKIAFSGWQDDHFDVFVMDADGTNMQRITQARKPNGKWSRNEDPVFSPDGRLLMYTSDRTGSSQIYISNLDGSEERRVTNDSHNYFKPKWSKNLE